MNLLYICAALFAGEWFASLRPAACGSWPLFAIAAALAALEGLPGDSSPLAALAQSLVGRKT